MLSMTASPLGSCPVFLSILASMPKYQIICGQALPSLLICFFLPYIHDSCITKGDACAGYEKLKPYDFHIHAGIDGGSNFVVYATVALNKEANCIMAPYSKAVAQHGRPLRLRADTRFEAAAAIGAGMTAH